MHIYIMNIDSYPYIFKCAYYFHTEFNSSRDVIIVYTHSSQRRLRNVYGQCCILYKEEHSNAHRGEGLPLHLGI